MSLYVKGFGAAAVRYMAAQKNFAKKSKIMKQQTSATTETLDKGKIMIDYSALLSVQLFAMALTFTGHSPTAILGLSVLHII